MKKFLLSAAAIMMAVSTMAVNPAKFELKLLQDGKEGTVCVLPNEMASAAMVFGDYDNDGDLDLFYVGSQGASNMHVGLLKNKGNAEFEAVTLSEDFVTLMLASAAWMDYNNDGNLDLIVVGTPDGTTTYTYVMKNLGPDESYAFEEDMDNYLPGVYCESGDYTTQHMIAPVDYDNDGWTDLVLNGNAGGKWDGEHGRMTALFKNVNGVFQFDADAQKATIGAEVFAQVNGGGVLVADINNDGYMDILLNGYDDNALKPDGESKGNGASYIYMNNGNGGYTKLDMTFPAANNQGLLIPIDANNDGWLDIVEIGRDLNAGWGNSANLFLNDKTGKFAKVDGDPGVVGGQTVVGMGDFNNDGFMDYAHTGWPTVSIAYGNGDGTFTEVGFTEENGLLPLSARGGATSAVDLNGDNTLDIHVAGWSDANGRWSDGIAFNTGKTASTPEADLPANAAPSAPTNLQVAKSGAGYTLTWDAATDDNTPAVALRYNVMAKAADGSVWMLVPADPATGKQKVAGLIPAYLQTLSYTFKGAGEYTFAVQAIDGANVGSAWTTTGTAVDNINAKDVMVEKIVENGTVYIIRNGEKFTVLGQTVK